MENTVNDIGVIHVSFQRIEYPSDLPRWKWGLAFNSNQYIKVENEGITWAVAAICTMEQLCKFMELHPILAPVIMRLRLSWQTSYPIETLIQKWKESNTNEKDSNKI